MEEHILHVDMNAFFASVEQARRPDLRGKPVIVCGDPVGRGVVSAASYEARKYGVRSAMAAATARKICPYGVFLPVDMSLYSEVSSQVFEILRAFSPLVEPASIDEAYLDVAGCDLFGSPKDIALKIKARIRQELGLTCSIGIATNRLLAKLASEMQKPDGLVILRKADLQEMVWPLPVHRLLGVGEKTAQRLREVGIDTIGQLAKAPADFMSQRFGAHGGELVRMAQGEDPTPLTVEHQKGKSLSRETTFARDVSDRESLRREFLELSEEVARRLRAHGLQAKTVTIKYRFPDFRTFTRAITLERYIDTTEPIFESCFRLFEANVPEGKALRLIGVAASGIVESRELRQGVLSLDAKDLKPVYGARDLLRGKFGRDVVKRASVMTEDRPEGGRR